MNSSRISRRAITVGIAESRPVVLLEDGQKTKLMFDHRGFPNGDGAHLAPGWYLNYWDPLAKFLAAA